MIYAEWRVAIGCFTNHNIGISLIMEAVMCTGIMFVLLHCYCCLLLYLGLLCFF